MSNVPFLNGSNSLTSSCHMLATSQSPNHQPGHALPSSLVPTEAEKDEQDATRRRHHPSVDVITWLDFRLFRRAPLAITCTSTFVLNF
jgi:hypothetical protein